VVLEVCRKQLAHDRKVKPLVPSRRLLCSPLFRLSVRPFKRIGLEEWVNRIFDPAVIFWAFFWAAFLHSLGKHGGNTAKASITILTFPIFNLLLTLQDLFALHQNGGESRAFRIMRNSVIRLCAQGVVHAQGIEGRYCRRLDHFRASFHYTLTLVLRPEFRGNLVLVRRRDS
jgi:hypothetical protein